MRRSAAFLILAAAALSACASKENGKTAPSVGAAPVPERSAESSTDQSLAEAVTNRIHALGEKDYRTVAAMALDGRVLITGAVVKPEQRRRAEETAAAVPGVVQVRDEIQLAEESFFDQYLPDTGREAALSNQLADDPQIKGQDYDLRVVNGIVYLLGRARSAEDVDHVKDMLTENPSVKWVVADVTAP